MLTSEVILGCLLSPKMQVWITVQISQLWPHELPVEPHEGRISCVRCPGHLASRARPSSYSWSCESLLCLWELLLLACCACLKDLGRMTVPPLLKSSVCSRAWGISCMWSCISAVDGSGICSKAQPGFSSPLTSLAYLKCVFLLLATHKCHLLRGGRFFLLILVVRCLCVV